MKRSVLLLFMLVTALSGCKSNSSEVDERDQAALAPGIAYVKRFLEEEGRLPTSSEVFHKYRGSRRSCSIYDRNSPYALARGAVGEHDYMIGVWSGEWNAYYQSWDGKYFNAYNEDIWLDSYDQFLEIRLANPADSPTTQAETAEEYLETARALGLSTESVWFVDIEVRKVTVCTRNCEPIIYSEGETITVPEISEDLSIDVSRVLPPADRMSGE